MTTTIACGLRRGAVTLALACVAARSAPAQTVTDSLAPFATRFFDTEVPLEITLTANFPALRTDRSADPAWRSATMEVVDGAQRRVIALRVRPRGVWRRKNCTMPPLRLNFARADVRGTPFEGLDRPRLVQFCDNTKRTAPYILQEYQLYRIYHLFTPMSFRARLAHVTYVDSGSTRPFARRWAFFLEEPAALEARTGTTAEPLRLGGDDLDPSARTLMGVFQYMIGNTDWSTMGLHNVAVFRRDSVFLPVPFDFDYSGAVNAHYAGVAPSVNIPNVRTRLYRGHCAPDSVFARTFAAFADRQPAIDSLYTDTIGRLLPEDVRRRTREYFAEFHRTIGDPARARRQIISRCLPNQ